MRILRLFTAISAPALAPCAAPAQGPQFTMHNDAPTGEALVYVYRSGTTGHPYTFDGWMDVLHPVRG